MPDWVGPLIITLAGGTFLWRFTGLLQVWLGRKVVDADAAGRLAHSATEMIESVRADATAEIARVRADTVAQIARASADVEQARRRATESEASSHMAWTQSVEARREVMAMAALIRKVVSEVRSPARSWVRLEELLGSEGDGGVLVNGAGQPVR